MGFCLYLFAYGKIYIASLAFRDYVLLVLCIMYYVLYILVLLTSIIGLSIFVAYYRLITKIRKRRCASLTHVGHHIWQ